MRSPSVTSTAQSTREQNPNNERQTNQAAKHRTIRSANIEEHGRHGRAGSCRSTPPGSGERAQRDPEHGSSALDLGRHRMDSHCAVLALWRNRPRRSGYRSSR